MSPFTCMYRRWWANYRTQVSRESTRRLIGSPAGLLGVGSKIHALHMQQLYHREISCCNNEVGWKDEEERQTTLFLFGKTHHTPYFTWVLLGFFNIYGLYLTVKALVSILISLAGGSEVFGLQ